MLTGEVVAQALGVMKERGWCRHFLEDGLGKVCAQGAVNQVLTGDARRVQSWVHFQAAMEALARHIPEDFKGSDLPGDYFACNRVVVYNNTRTDFSEVETWFEKTAADEGYAVEPGGSGV